MTKLPNLDDYDHNYEDDDPQDRPSLYQPERMTILPADESDEDEE